MADYSNLGNYGPFQEEFLEMFGIGSTIGSGSSSGIDFYNPYGTPGYGHPQASPMSEFPEMTESDYLFYRDSSDSGEGTNLWKAFNLDEWMGDFGQYLPTFNKGDIEDIDIRGDVSYNKSINSIINNANMSKMLLDSGTYSNNQTWNNFVDSLSSTARLERFQTVGEKNSLYQEYADDLFSQFDVIAELGGFDLGDPTYDLETPEGEATVYTHEISNELCNDMCGTGYNNYWHEEKVTSDRDCFESCIKMSYEGTYEGWDPYGG